MIVKNQLLFIGGKLTPVSNTKQEFVTSESLEIINVPVEQAIVLRGDYWSDMPSSALDYYALDPKIFEQLNIRKNASDYLNKLEVENKNLKSEIDSNIRMIKYLNDDIKRLSNANSELGIKIDVLVKELVEESEKVWYKSLYRFIKRYI